MSSLNVTFSPLPPTLNNPYIREGEFDKELTIYGLCELARIRFTAETTISQIQEILASAEICPKAQQRLIMRGQQCDGSETLKDLFQKAYKPGICLIMRLKSSVQPLKQ